MLECCQQKLHTEGFQYLEMVTRGRVPSIYGAYRAERNVQMRSKAVDVKVMLPEKRLKRVEALEIQPNEIS